ncbi:chloroplast envelope quinone oxidoreductase homolog [Dioscorea cayenensis subsp. rotundata]|uniref:Chloroplast envelope quinone oxidoreductase homolog n=1 Tax=Dioscorea cayennensis subsp. rotundata TaxID=55577 RepID=A0AB40BI09_DIOCR|nr:chloroplast envelope quinone oxidoreductase homolog [Dioscorea cayenensis subsp. rotundata]
MASKIMRAVWYDSYGGGAAGLKHVEVPIPSPKKDQILLKVEAAALNPIDLKIQKGIARPILPPKFPFIPVTDVAGEVVEVGPGANRFKPGDKVVSMVSYMKGGGLAEYAVAGEALTVTRPPEVSPAEGAGLPIAALTALQALKTTGINFDGTSKSSNVLITAASGGVGHYAVQLAKLANSHVTATCGARNVELVKSLGADEVLDYKTPEGASLKSPSGKKYDSVVHCTIGISWSIFEPNLNANAKVVDITPTPWTIISSTLKKLTFPKKQLVPMFVSPKKEDMEFLVELVKEGKLKTLVDSKHSFSKAEEAWAKLMDGHATGKVIIEM